METATHTFSLSRQEERVVALAMEGLGDKEVAQEMGLSVGTVRTYWKRIQLKVRGNTRAEIVATVARLQPQKELDRVRELNARLQAEIVHRREAEARFRAICTCSPVGIFVSDLRGDCVYVNPAWERIAGVSRADAMGGTWRKVVHPDDVPRLEKWWSDQHDASPSTPTEFRFQSPLGTVWVRCTFSHMVIDGRTLGYVGTIEDVSSRRDRPRSEDATKPMASTA